MQRISKSSAKEISKAKELIPLCRAGKLDEVKDLIKACPDIIYTRVPTEIYTYQKGKGAVLNKIDMSLVAYCFYHADYHVLEAIYDCLDDKDKDMMLKLHLEMFNVANCTNYHKTCASLLEVNMKMMLKS
jgi:hypothetical protein